MAAMEPLRRPLLGLAAVLLLLLLLSPSPGVSAARAGADAGLGRAGAARPAAGTAGEGLVRADRAPSRAGGGVTRRAETKVGRSCHGSELGRLREALSSAPCARLARGGRQRSVRLCALCADLNAWRITSLEISKRG